MSHAYFFHNRYCTKVALKRPRFSTTVVVKMLPELKKEDKKWLWWNEEEVEFILSQASYGAEETRRNRMLVDTLDQALRDARRSALMSNNSNSVDLEWVTPLRDRDPLYLWCQYGHSRRGLEKMVSQAHQITRNNIASKIRSKIVMLSRSGEGVEEIRVASEKMSRSSILFARMMGAADEQAALHPLAERRRSATSASKRIAGDAISDSGVNQGRSKNVGYLFMHSAI